MNYTLQYTTAELTAAAQKLIATNPVYAKLTPGLVVILANRGSQEIQRLLNEILESTAM